MVHTDTLVLKSDFSVSTRLYENQKNPVTPRLDRGAHAKPQSHFAKTSNPLKPHSGYRGSQKAYGDPELKSGIREDGDRLPRYLAMTIKIIPPPRGSTDICSFNICTSYIPVGRHAGSIRC